MEVELLEIRQFLQQHPPFDLLPEQALDQLTELLQITYLRRDKPFPPQNNMFYVLRSGAVELCVGDRSVCEQLAEGDVFASGCTLLQLDNYDRGRTIEDTLLYAADCELLYRLCQENPEFGGYFTASVRDRLKSALASMQPEQSGELGNHQTVAEILRKGPVCLDAAETVQAAAQLMTERGVSSLLITEQAKLAGIVTDRDIRKRCVATGLAVDTTVEQIMTRSPYTIASETPISEALLHMTRLGVHHLPVMEGERVIGMFTATDVVLNQGGNAALLATSIGKAKTLDDLIESSSRIPLLHRQLVRNGASVSQIGETLSHMTDAITVRLLQFAEAELGPPPVPYVWMAGGSQGRHEQSSHSDQDNALLIDDAMLPEHDDYFATMARTVSDGLNACGYVYCPGNAMASNPQWRQPLATWIGYFNRWIMTPEPMALMLASI
jgi:CBS domain-containing protein